MVPDRTRLSPGIELVLREEGRALKQRVSIRAPFLRTFESWQGLSPPATPLPDGDIPSRQVISQVGAVLVFESNWFPVRFL
jgi:hypothetical protein